jgi:uncharacterized DUF497 family protein
MTKIKVKSIIWDAYNTKHIKKHNILIIEAEEAGKKLIYHKRTYKNRFLVIGKSKNRLITLILDRESVGAYYLVTARDSNRKERKKANEIKNL